MIQLTHAGVRFQHKNMFSKMSPLIYKSAEPALDDITLWIGKGESFAVLGGKKAGKTTLLRLISKHIPPDTGSLTVRGRVASAIAEYDGLDENETGGYNVRKKLLSFGADSDDINACMIEAAKLFSNDSLFVRRVFEYDDTERSRLITAAAIAAKPDVLLIANALDALEKPFQQQCIIEIRRMLREGMSLLIESDDSALLARLCDSAVLLRAGKLHRIGALEELYTYRSIKNMTGQFSAAFSAPLTPDKRAFQKLREAALTLKNIVAKKRK